jgi:hypothetical protein
VADKKYFYHIYVMLLFAGKCHVLQGIPGVLWFALKLPNMANLSKLLLPVSSKISSKPKILTTNDYSLVYCHKLSKYIT